MMGRLLLYCVLAFSWSSFVSAWTFVPTATGTRLVAPRAAQGPRERHAKLHMAINPELEREAAMSIDEIKAELELRGVDYSEAVTKTDLVVKLIASRSLGKADADNIFEKFNEVADTPVDKNMFDSDVVQDSVAGDGALPGGMNPELMKVLANDREIMGFLKDPKFQDIMKAVMTGGPEGLKKYMSDPDAIRMLQKLSAAMARVQSAAGSPPPSSSSSYDADDGNILQ